MKIATVHNFSVIKFCKISHFELCSVTDTLKNVLKCNIADM